jgi:hypothetical protein
MLVFGGNLGFVPCRPPELFSFSAKSLSPGGIKSFGRSHVYQAASLILSIVAAKPKMNS